MSCMFHHQCDGGGNVHPLLIAVGIAVVVCIAVALIRWEPK